MAARRELTKLSQERPDLGELIQATQKRSESQKRPAGEEA